MRMRLSGVILAGSMVVALPGTGWTVGLPVSATPLVGATQAIVMIEAGLKQASSAKASATGVDEYQRFKRDLAAFAGSNQTRPPDETAAEWVKLADRLMKLQKKMIDVDPSTIMDDEDVDMEPLSLSKIVAALPPPETWSAIDAILRAPGRVAEAKLPCDAGLRLLLAFLNGDAKAMKRELDNITELKKKYSNLQHIQMNDLDSIALQMQGSTTGTRSRPMG